MNRFKPLKNILLSNDVFIYIIYIIIFTIIIAVVLWLYSILILQNDSCKILKKIYKNEIAPIYPITNDQIFNEPLYNFYIKTAYNAACIGNFKNSFVDSSKTNPPFCALETCIRQGARCLDFEIYSFNDKPVIATSSVNSVFIKETFNYLDFKDAMRYINQAAFNVSTTSLYTDPLILNFRIMSKRKNNPIYPIIASNLLSSFGDRLLSSKYNLMNNCKNLGSRPLSEFKEKVIIIIDSNTYEELKNICPLINNRICNNQPDSLNNRITDKVEELPNQKEDINNIVCQSPNLLEFVNMNSGSPFIKTLRLYDFKLEDIDNIKHINKLSMTILLPNYNKDSINLDPNIGFTSGCQLIGMSFQNFDINMEYYSLFFIKAGYAFAYKPKLLRYKKQYIKVQKVIDNNTNLEPKEMIFTGGDGVSFPIIPIRNCWKKQGKEVIDICSKFPPSNDPRCNC